VRDRLRVIKYCGTPFEPLKTVEIRCGSLLPRRSVHLLNGGRATSEARTISARFAAELHFAE
jgi:hypothetical protein